MDHPLDTGVPKLPVKARWELPPMAKGDMWSGSYTVPAEAAGYYRAMANAYTHGPDGGLWLFDDMLGGAWMYVSETGGQLTRFGRVRSWRHGSWRHGAALDAQHPRIVLELDATFPLPQGFSPTKVFLCPGGSTLL